MREKGRKQKLFGENTEEFFHAVFIAWLRVYQAQRRGMFLLATLEGVELYDGERFF